MGAAIAGIILFLAMVAWIVITGLPDDQPPHLP